MNVITTALVIWSIYVGDQTAEALTCLHCDYVVQPRHCQTVIACADDHACFVERQTNTFGEVGYSVGCREKRSCVNSTASSSNCFQCCDRDVCNQAGCGEEGYPIQRGPLCYVCQNPLPEGRCHHVEVCQDAEMCRANGQDMFGTTLFTSSCIQKELCASQQHGVLVGRSSPLKIPVTRSHGPQDCFHCCHDDLCNKNCQPRGQPPAVTPGVSPTTATIEGTTILPKARDCSELHNMGHSLPSGVYTITTALTHTKIHVYCDMETDGGGWTVFQKRFNGSVDFTRNFSDYENGFGSVYAEYWLGLKYIHEMTSRGSYQLRVDIVRANGSNGYDVYGNFSLQPGTKYTLNIGSRLRSNGVDTSKDFTTSGGSAGNAFSTYDHDVDRWSNGNCAAEFGKGGWWYNNCKLYINLNALYRPGQLDINAMTYDFSTGLAASTMMFKKCVINTDINK